jgi:hypothetical protein
LENIKYIKSRNIIILKFKENKLLLIARSHAQFSNKLIEFSAKLFKNEIYFDSGKNLFFLIFFFNNPPELLSKFISYYFKKYHRTNKINKFFNFLQKFVNLTNQKNLPFNSILKGLKIQIKGRFKGSSRTKIRIFESGSIPLQTINSNIRYSMSHINSSYGVFGIKIWILESKV